MTDWKQQYEDASEAESARFDRMSVADLLREIVAGRTGDYYGIWRAVGAKATPGEAAWVLYDVLRSDRPYLARYHCADALLRVIGSTEFEPVALSAPWPEVANNLVRLRDRVEQVAGPRPAGPADGEAATAPAAPSAGALPRSAFVTGLAWTFIVLAGFATVTGVLQNMMLALVFPLDAMRESMRDSPGFHDMPAFLRFAFEHFQLLFAAFLALSVLTLVAATGLLRRRNWARLAFIGILAAGIAWNLASVAMPFLVFPSFPPLPDHAPAEFRDHFDLFRKIVTAFVILMAVGMSVLFAWIIRRLMSTEIRQEFAASAETGRPGT